MAKVYTRLDTILVGSRRFTLPLLRISLGIVYIWFGALKLSDSTPVAQLVAKTVPFIPEHIFVPVLGAVEVLIGLALVLGRLLDLVALVMVGHLAGTFLVLVTQPGESFQNGNIFELTMTGEFVMKNIVLITAGLVLATRAREHTPKHAAATMPAVPVVETPLAPEPATQFADGI
jgi:uncharacterized membrane protein YphA (DoxX/SURF4 family)